MRNRAKCKLCNSIIESFHATDYVDCKCGEIGVDGGEALRCCAKSWDNFLRVDDEGNEIPVKIEELTKYDRADMEPYSYDESEKRNASTNEKQQAHDTKPHKKDIIIMLDNMISDYDKLPQHVLQSPISHYDFLSLLLIISAFAKEDIS